MKIVSIRAKSNYTHKQLKTLSEIGKFIEITGQKYKYQELLDQIKDADIMIVSPSGIERVSDEMLLKMPRLKYISLLSVGYDFVDIKAAKARQIPISNLNGVNAESVAEHIWAMILCLSKRVNEFDRDIRSYGENDYRKYKGLEIYGKTIGIIGTGKIGGKVARISKAFNMTILGCNKSNSYSSGIEIVSFKKLLAESDIITVCVPLSQDTINLISEPEFQLMKDNVILINCAREQIVNKKAVIDALKTEKIFGYGLETNNMNEIPLDDPYLSSNRIVITGHNASNTSEAELMTNEQTIANVQAFFRKKILNPVS